MLPMDFTTTFLAPYHFLTSIAIVVGTVHTTALEFPESPGSNSDADAFLTPLDCLSLLVILLVADVCFSSARIS